MGGIMFSQYMSVPEVAALFKVSKPTIYAWAKKPDFPVLYHKPGAIGFKREEVIAYYAVKSL